MQLAIDNLFNSCNREDLILFYFSGHGTKDNKCKFYLTTSQTTKDSKRIIVPTTAVAAGYLQGQMNDCISERQVIILDCCYSSAIVQGLTIKGDEKIDVETELGGKGRAILTSSSSTQESFVGDNSKLSIYTQYLVEGIKTGAADLDGDGYISVSELHQYTSQRVQLAAPAMTPEFYQIKQDEDEDIYLAHSVRDARLTYRQEAEGRAKQGGFSFVACQILEQHRLNLGLTNEEAEAIKADIIRPYQEYEKKMQEYKQTLQEVLEQKKYLSEETLRELEELKEILELRDEDVKTISNLVPPSLQVFEFDVITIDATGQEIKREKNKQGQYFRKNLCDGVDLDIVAIPAGTFWMGTEDKELERLCKE